MIVFVFSSISLLSKLNIYENYTRFDHHQNYRYLTRLFRVCTCVNLQCTSEVGVGACPDTWDSRGGTCRNDVVNVTGFRRDRFQCVAYSRLMDTGEDVGMRVGVIMRVAVAGRESECRQE